MKILLVEDDKSIANFIIKGLKEESYLVDHEEDGEDGLYRAESFDYDLLIVDVMLPGMSGHKLCATLRKRGVETPIIMLTAKTAVRDKIKGFEAGADDYITKPFSFDEFLARVRAILRRRKDRFIDLNYGELKIETISHRVYFKGEELLLRPKEYLLLRYMIINKGRILSRTQILENVWGYNFDPSTNVIDVYIKHLRDKISPLFGKNVIRTVRGVGYMMEDLEHD